MDMMDAKRSVCPPCTRIVAGKEEKKVSDMQSGFGNNLIAPVGVVVVW